MKNLEGKVVLIIGGLFGLGKVIVECFGKEGVKIVIVDIDEKVGKFLVDELFEVCFIKIDVIDYMVVKVFIDFMVENYGVVDIIFNNAGIDGE